MRNQYDDHIRHNKQIRLDSIAVRPVFYILTGEKQGSYGADPGYFFAVHTGFLPALSYLYEIQLDRFFIVVQIPLNESKSVFQKDPL